MTKPHQPWFIRTPTPPNPKKIHLIGIAGSAMGAFACMLDDAGFEVRGSDQNIYPPMSDTLASRKIPVMIGQKAEHLEWNPDWIIIGNVCRRDHPEVLAAQDKDLPYSSFPAIFGCHCFSVLFTSRLSLHILYNIMLLYLFVLFQQY